MHPRVVAVATAVPPHRYAQETLLEMAGRDRQREAFFLNSDIRYRHLYFEPGFRGGETLDEMNERARRGALEIGGRALRCLMQRAGLAPGEIHFLATTTCTVTLCPQLDTLFIRDLSLGPCIQRAHIGDSGCASAMVALQAAWNHVRAYPNHRAVIAAVEICSAAYYRDGSAESAIGEAIFADGAGALCLAGGDGRPGFEVLAHHTVIRPEYLHLMGFEFPGGYRRLVLSKDVRQIGAQMLAQLTREMLRAHALQRSDIRFWILHAAGRKVLDNAQAALGLSDEDMAFSRAVLRDYGNMSSATVLFVLERVIESGLPRQGDLAVMAALGPGFAAEGALLEWRG
ncbi:MAG: 3-oxoacyl-[acyl-carrier-protein] synthase III C-terminal domain-containing protein [Bryobacterales bacterium]|nr:3-oxoacyl-[acyl-carrier-protein] synthase III C-terminal domain-containing protein [Bryobacterales bacterium]